MEFCCLGSGSKGNATLVKQDQTLIMIDCGFSLKNITQRLHQRDLDASDLSAILVTHEHSDHIGGVNTLAKRYNLPVYVTRGTARSNKIKDTLNIQWIDLDKPFEIDSIKILPVAVPHDAKEPCQFILTSNDKHLGVMTDLGSVSKHVMDAYEHCDALLLEANHDVDMLWAGQYPLSLKRRVAGDWGHLSNVQAEQFLSTVNLKRLKTLVLGHISEKNNSLDKVKTHFSPYEQQLENVLYATQEHGFPWIHV